MRGTVDRSLLTEACSGYFSPQVLEDYAASLNPLGPPAEFAPSGRTIRGGMTIRNFRIRAGKVAMELTMMTWPDGKIEQYIVSRSG